MRRIKEVLRLKLEAGLSDREIALSCRVARSTVAEYMKRASEAGVLSWPLPKGVDDIQLEELLFKKAAGITRQERPQPDFKMIHNELRHKSVTLQLLWEEYKESNPAGYQYTQFCELYRAWAKKLDLVLRQPHRAGEKLFVDYAGPKIEIVDDKTGAISEASIFVSVMGASTYTYVEATARQDLMSWIGSHIRAFEFMGGCPAVVVPDNLKAGVIRPCRYEPKLNPTYEEMAAHYGVAIMPARPRKPRDKAYVSYCTLLLFSNG